MRMAAAAADAAVEDGHAEGGFMVCAGIGNSDQLIIRSAFGSMPCWQQHQFMALLHGID